MSDLTDLPLALTYRTGRDDLAGGFFVPCLEAAVLYRRAAGYFTSAGLALAAREADNQRQIRDNQTNLRGRRVARRYAPSPRQGS